jgi:septal ring factor EnvC (AmiA/AmiB activator)
LRVAELETLVGHLGDLYGAQQARVQELQEQIQGFDQQVTVLTNQRDRLDNRLHMQGHHIYRLERQLQQAEDHGPRGWYGQPNQPNRRRRHED